MDIGNFVSLKEYNYESFQKPNPNEFSFTSNDNWSSERTYIQCSVKAATLPLVYIFKCLMLQKFNLLLPNVFQM